MSEQVYKMPPEPVYHEAIPKLRRQDPGDAETVLNPLLQALVENTHFVRKLAEKIAEQNAVDHAAIRRDTAKAISAAVGAIPTPDVSGQISTHDKAAGAHETKFQDLETQIEAAKNGSVPTTRKVNGKALSSDISLSADDVRARPSNWTPAASDVGARPSTWMPTADDVKAVPVTRKVNGKALSEDISLTASDVKALPEAGGTVNGNMTITGNLTLKGSKNYGTKINLGDGDYVHISESVDDCMELKAKKINLVVSDTSLSGFTVNGRPIRTAPPLDELAAVEIRVDTVGIWDVSTESVSSNVQYYHDKTEASKYGSISIAEKEIEVRGNTKGKGIGVYGTLYAVFEDGYRIELLQLLKYYADCKGAVSWPVGYYLSISGSSSEGVYTLACCGQDARESRFTDSASGTTTLVWEKIDEQSIEVYAAVAYGSGTQRTRMSFTNLTLDGRRLPVRVVSKLL